MKLLSLYEKKYYCKFYRILINFKLCYIKIIKFNNVYKIFFSAHILIINYDYLLFTENQENLQERCNEKRLRFPILDSTTSFDEESELENSSDDVGIYFYKFFN